MREWAPRVPQTTTVYPRFRPIFIFYISSILACSRKLSCGKVFEPVHWPETNRLQRGIILLPDLFLPQACPEYPHCPNTTCYLEYLNIQLQYMLVIQLLSASFFLFSTAAARMLLDATVWPHCLTPPPPSPPFPPFANRHISLRLAFFVLLFSPPTLAFTHPHSTLQQVHIACCCCLSWMK